MTQLKTCDFIERSILSSRSVDLERLRATTIGEVIV